MASAFERPAAIGLCWVPTNSDNFKESMANLQTMVNEKLADGERVLSIQVIPGSQLHGPRLLVITQKDARKISDSDE